MLELGTTSKSGHNRKRYFVGWNSFGVKYGLGFIPTLILIVLVGSPSLLGEMATRDTQFLEFRYATRASAAFQHLCASSYSAAGPFILVAGSEAEITTPSKY